MSNTLARQKKSNVSAREVQCEPRNSTTEPAKTQEYNVDTIREEIKSYLASALHLFEQLPSGPKATGHPGTQS